MRAAGILAISAAAHVAVLLALPGPSVRLVAIAAPPAIEVTPAPDDITPIEVVTIDQPAAAAAPQASDLRPQASGQSQNQSQIQSRSSRGTPRAEAGGLTPGASAAAEGAAADDTGPLAMRGAQPQHRSLDMSIGSDVIDKIMNEPPPAEVPESGRLETSKDGTITVPDLTFTAHVNPDGTIASIDDKPNFHFKVHIPHPKRILRAVGQHVAAWAEDPYGTATDTGHDALGNPGDPHVHDKSNDTDGRVYTIIDGGFDVTDAIMRAVGQDPYSARKRAALEATFDERVQIGEAYRAQQDATSDQLMLRNLKEVWGRVELDAAAKREAIFELWDECVETGPDDQVAAAKKARAALYRWVNVHLKAGSADAFTDDELARFNARKKSHDTFAPYPVR